MGALDFDVHRLALPVIETAIAAGAAWLVLKIGDRFIDRATQNNQKRYRWHKLLSTLLSVAAVVVIGSLWASRLEHAGTFAGLIGAGVAVALRDPLLSIAARIAIFVGHIYNVGDRVEINKMAGDVIDIGFFYTRLMEVGNWISADQASGRIVQFSNSMIFGNAVFNYTQNFGYIWDELELPVTYDSNIQAASAILLEVGGNYTDEFLKGAQTELRRMQRYFLVPSFEVKPAVYIAITSNWISLKMRYVVDPRQRRDAQNFIWGEVFARIQGRKDVAIGSSTMDLTVHGAKPRSSSDEQPGDKPDLPPQVAA
jgi:small-conductance mechanosensitive channel